MTKRNLYTRIFAVCFLTLSTSCTTLVGSVSPLDQKDTAHYTVMDLAQTTGSTWTKLDTKTAFQAGEEVDTSLDAFSSERADLAFQSKKNRNLISLDTSCREGKKDIQNLEPYLRELLLGITRIQSDAIRSTEVAGQKAVERTVDGTLDGERTKIRAIVFSRANCVYDLLYVTNPDDFNKNEEDFSRFVSSLKLR